MKTLLTTLLAVFLFVTPAKADTQPFFEATSGQWGIFGHPGSENMNPACVMRTVWEDGSRLMIIQDLADGELYIFFENMKWNVTGPYNTQHSMKLNFYSRTLNVSLNATMFLTSKNTITIRGIKHDAFLEPFVESDRMVFLMPGTVPDAAAGLRGSREAVEFVKACMRASNNIKLRYPTKKGGQDT